MEAKIEPDPEVSQQRNKDKATVTDPRAVDAIGGKGGSLEPKLTIVTRRKRVFGTKN